MVDENQASATAAAEKPKIPARAGAGKAKETAQLARIKELEQQLRDSKNKAEKLEMKSESLLAPPVVQESDETKSVIANLLQKVEALEKQSQYVPTIDGKKPKYRERDPKDLLDDTVTFTARCVLKAIPGYRDPNGREVIAPYEIILLTFAASDIRQDGREDDIVNFCNYTTAWGPEIEFLRNHPEYGTTFGENMNEVAGHNVRDYQFKVRAGQQVSDMSAESVLQYAAQLKIPNYRSKAIRELKPKIVEHIVSQYREEEKLLSDELAARMFAKVGKFK